MKAASSGLCFFRGAALLCGRHREAPDESNRTSRSARRGHPFSLRAGQRPQPGLGLRHLPWHRRQGGHPGRGSPRRTATRAHRHADARVPRRHASGDGDAPDREGLYRRADRRHGELVRRAEEVIMKRRDFLKVAGAASLVGCATPLPAKARVVVIGGGYGGATAAKYIRMWDPSIDVVLVERDASFISCPISNLVLAGYTSMDEISRGYDGLRR